MPNSLHEVIERFHLGSVLVVGDVMLDRIISGNVRRISPEAPVPVVELQERSFTPGGAANVATNIASLGGKVLLAGVVGQDEGADQLRGELLKANVDTSGLMSDADRPTTTKTRIVAHSQQVVRVDEEARGPLPNATVEALLNWISEKLDVVGALVLSDYAKGVLSDEFCKSVIPMARNRGVPVIVDPKGMRYEKYAGATLLTPNLHEAEAAAGRLAENDATLEQIADDLLVILEGASVLITRGADGMSLFRANGNPLHIPTAARAVYDVTGAGDTVIATLALSLAMNAELDVAATLANHAAGIAVGKLGTSTVSSDELIEELAHSSQ